jgi:stage II sporulation protein AA (anti-sigma F factor antagonist)
MTEEAPRPGLLGAGSHELAAVSASEHDGTMVVTVSGEVDISNVDRVAQVIFTQPNTGDGLIVDLSQVRYLDSTAVSLLHDLALRLRHRAQRLVVVSPAGSPPRRVLELTALSTNAPLVDELESALSLLGDA